MWKRKSAEIEYDWDVADYEEEVRFLAVFFLDLIIAILDSSHDG